MKGGKPRAFSTVANHLMLDYLRHRVVSTLLVIEQMKCYGMPVGDDVLMTVFWSGRFAQAWRERGGSVALLPRKTVVTVLCGSARATDANVSQRLRDIYGEKGTKKNPGMLYGIKGDMWSALAIATAAREIGTLEEVE